MPYANEHAARVRDPSQFQEGSFRSSPLSKGDSKGGIRIIMGKLKGQSTMTVQAYRFPADRYTAAEARAWLRSHNIKYISFEPAAG